MRPVARHQSALVAPLNAILGTEANLRILRVLAMADQEVSVGDLTRATGITAPGLRKALRVLEETGVVALGGTARGRRAGLRVQHPLTRAIIGLFAVEAKRVSGLWGDLSVLVSGTPALAAWVEGSVAMGEDELHDSIELWVLADSGDVDNVREALEPGLERIDRKWAVMVELRPTTRADLAVGRRKRLLDVKPLLGPPPTAFVPKRKRGKLQAHHSDHDARSLAIGVALAALIEKDSSVFTRTLKHLTSERPTNPDQKEWLRILRSSSPARVRALLVEPGERATRLRQSLPFLRALTDSERSALRAEVDGG